MTTLQRIPQGRSSSLEGSEIFPVDDGRPGVHAGWQRRVGDGLPVREVVVQIVERFQALKSHRVRFLGDGGGDHAALNPFEGLRVHVHGHDDDFACQVEPVHRSGRGEVPVDSKAKGVVLVFQVRLPRRLRPQVCDFRLDSPLLG